MLGAVALAGALVAGLAPAAGAAPPSCRVKNPTQGSWFATQTGAALTRAINAANPGDRLNVFGRCRGSFSIEKDLQLFGNTNRQAPTVLDGAGGTGGGGVLFVNEREHPDPEPHHGQRQRPRRLRLLTGRSCDRFVTLPGPAGPGPGRWPRVRAGRLPAWAVACAAGPPGP